MLRRSTCNEFILVSNQFGSGPANTDIIFPSREHHLRLHIAIHGVGRCVGCCSAQHSDHFTLASIWLLLSLSPYSILGARKALISLTNMQSKQGILCIKKEKKRKTQNRLFCCYCYGVKLLKHIFLLLLPLSSARLTVLPSGTQCRPTGFCKNEPSCLFCDGSTVPSVHTAYIPTKRVVTTLGGAVRGRSALAGQAAAPRVLPAPKAPARQRYRSWGPAASAGPCRPLPAPSLAARPISPRGRLPSSGTAAPDGSGAETSEAALCQGMPDWLTGLCNG